MLKKSKYILLASVIFLFFTGCDTLLKTAKIGQNATAVDRLIVTGAALDIIISVEATDEEIQPLRDAVEFYGGFKDRWGDALKLTTLPSATVSVLSIDYNELVRHYKNVESFVEAKWLHYSERERELIRGYKDKIIVLDEAVTSLIVKGERVEAILTALEVGKTVLDIVAARK